MAIRIIRAKGQHLYGWDKKQKRNAGVVRAWTLMVLSECDGRAGIGVVIRSHLGSVLLSSWRAEDVEARACYEGVRLATEWENGRTILESDCEVLIKTTQLSPRRQGAPVQRKTFSSTLSTPNSLMSPLDSSSLILLSCWCFSPSLLYLSNCLSEYCIESIWRSALVFVFSFEELEQASLSLNHKKRS
jgi:hypothetical protein